MDIPTFTIYVPHIAAPKANHEDPVKESGTLLTDKMNSTDVLNDSDGCHDGDYEHGEYDSDGYFTSSEENAAKEDYNDTEDETAPDGGTRIYKLDPESVDILPDTLATAKPVPPPIQSLNRDPHIESSRDVTSNLTENKNKLKLNTEISQTRMLIHLPHMVKTKLKKGQSIKTQTEQTT